MKLLQKEPETIRTGMKRAGMAAGRLLFCLWLVAVVSNYAAGNSFQPEQPAADGAQHARPAKPSVNQQKIVFINPFKLEGQEAHGSETSLANGAANLKAALEEAVGEADDLKLVVYNDEQMYQGEHINNVLTQHPLTKAMPSPKFPPPDYVIWIYYSHPSVEKFILRMTLNDAKTGFSHSWASQPFDQDDPELSTMRKLAWMLIGAMRRDQKLSELPRYRVFVRCFSANDTKMQILKEFARKSVLDTLQHNTVILDLVGTPEDCETAVTAELYVFGGIMVSTDDQGILNLDIYHEPEKKNWMAGHQRVCKGWDLILWESHVRAAIMELEQQLETGAFRKKMATMNKGKTQ